MASYAMLVVALLVNGTASLFIKAAARRAGPEGSIVGQLADWRFLAGLGCFGLALVCYSFALRRIDLSVGYPVMTGGGLILVTAISALLFAETITPIRLAGIVCILVGVILASR
jgi:multidrug transporter EmrE-like cation transporter